MSVFWSEKIREILPYVPGEQPQDKQYIKLNTNESPYPPSPMVAETLRAFDPADLRLYPDPQQGRLRAALADYTGLTVEQIFVGNGSDEILAFAFRAFFNPCPPGERLPAAEQVLTPEIGYSFYPVYAELYDIALKAIALRDDFRIAVEDYEQPARAVILANPNAPTAVYLTLDEIRTLCEQDSQRLVIVDEAYVDYSPGSALALLPFCPNLLVIQTFSKSRSLAGLRLGFAAASEALIQGLERMRDSFNSYTVGRLVSEVGIASLQDAAYFAVTTAEVMATREKLKVKLREMGSYTTDSQANFLWLRHPCLSGEAVYRALRERGILLRYFHAPHLQNYVRLTIGSPREMDLFLQAYAALS